jgi:D-galactarolactone cycloisomerase
MSEREPAADVTGRGVPRRADAHAPADMSFTIVGVEAFHLVVPGKTYWNGLRPDNRTSTDRFLLKPGWRTVYAQRVETALVRVTFADGTIGWGEVTEPICPEVICTLATELIAPLAGGTEFSDPAALWDFAYDLNRCRGHAAGYHCLAMGALDTAVWDAIGRRENRTVASLISTTLLSAVDVYLSGVRRASREERVRALRAFVDDGLGAVKFFIDADLDEALGEIEAMRAAVGDACLFATDALWSFETVEAAAIARRRLAELDVAWLECPLIPEDFHGHLQLMNEPGVPVALGEHFATHHQSSAWLGSKALHVFQPDISRTGFSDGLRQSRIAGENDILVTPHMGAGSPIVQAIAMQAWLAGDGKLPCEYQYELSTMLPDVFDSGWVYSGGRLNAPDRPGLGVDVNVDALAGYCAGTRQWRIA